MGEREVYIFCIGRELLEGVVLDRNATFMAKNATEAGFRVRSVAVLDEREAEVVDAFQRALATEPAYILVTGGMGPGLDDITRDCVAKAAGVPLVLDPKAEEMLANSYRRIAARGVVESADLDDERRKMARIPEGATCFENPIGTAPAVRLEVGKTRFFLMPGMPDEMRRMFAAWVAPILEAEGPGEVRGSRVIESQGGDEATISRMLADLQRRHAGVRTRAKIQAGAGSPSIRILLAADGSDEDAVESLLDTAAADLRARLGLEVARDAGE